MYYPQDKLTLGVGLFNTVSPNRHLTEYIEQKIISELDLNSVMRCARINSNPWKKCMTEEIKKRKCCVTVYIWQSGDTSSQRNRGCLGHVAIRTYSGNLTEKGVYISFYPGDCDRNNRHPTCKKSVSHFHSWSQDNRNGVVAIDLYNLDVAAINSLFERMHDSNMNSFRQWSSRYNCSDVVLDLLQQS